MLLPSASVLSLTLRSGRKQHIAFEMFQYESRIYNGRGTELESCIQLFIRFLNDIFCHLVNDFWCRLDAENHVIAELYSLAPCIPTFGVSDVREILELINTTETDSVAGSRPLKVINYLKVIYFHCSKMFFFSILYTCILFLEYLLPILILYNLQCNSINQLLKPLIKPFISVLQAVI